MLSMFLAYKVFLARENQHGYNRGVLLAIYFVSFAALPLTALAHTIFNTEVQGPVSVEGIGVAGTVITPMSNPVWGTVLIWGYIIGVTIVSAQTVATWIKLLNIINKSDEKIQMEGYVIVLIDNERVAPFSWTKYIVINRSDFNDNSHAIIVHEMKHISCRHWIDLLVAQIVCIINWFNPAAWLMRDELMLVHEYQADAAVIDNGNNPRDYQMLLIKKAVGSRFPSLANSLNHSKLKKRITMMYKEKSSAGQKMKALALVPMLALALCVAAVPAVRAAVSTISSSKLSVNKSSENASQAQAGVKVFKVTNISNKGNVTTVTICGKGLGNSITVSGGTFTSMGKDHKAKSLNCEMTDGEATIKAVFPFLSEFDKSKMTLTINGEEVPFDLENFFNKAQVAEVMPQYPGGETAIMNAVMSKVSFPGAELRWKPGASGLTVVGFTVFTDGTIGDFRCVHSCGYGDLDQIAIDAVKNGLTEKWTPGIVGGKPVAVSYSIPIRFKQKS